ncbi:hypothetical protein F5Y08DRAFT_326004 [Xylaria arbuscula]|nr:hypothetical protein F5Y08DRAFT_326004 [Xylaria arbuscula]
MADSGSPAQEPEGRRRKIRKGTHSCWECKRRKNRCTWSRSEGRCDGCHRRGTRCISQEFPQEHVPPERGAITKLDDSRILRLEALVERLSRQVDSEISSRHRAESHLDDGSDGPQVSIGTSDIAADSPTPSALNKTTPSLIIAPVGSSFGQFGDATDYQITPAIHALISAWPEQRHHDAIINSNATSLHPALSSACSGFQFPPSPKDLLQLPLPGTTPSAIARKLLVLGTYLQVLSSQNNHGDTESSPEYRSLSSRALETASKLITHNDSLPQSLDIIECLIIESQYYNYMGNIRRAWTILRRAVAMAQLLGLDRQNKSIGQNTNVVDDQGASRQQRIWFLLVHFDQYVSLVLGTPPSLPEHCQVTPEILERCTPSGRMGWFHSMAAGRILHRNRINMYDIVETREIDKILREATTCMPARWWLLPTWSDTCSDDDFASIETRLMVHFAHHNILLQLHLPFMLHSLHGQRYYYSITAVIHSCREILTRFTTFRNHHPSVSYCRGLDFFTFVASAALCLLHVNASCETHAAGHCDGVGISELLAHQRFSNRGLMEQALENIEKIAQVEPDDRLTSEIIPTFRRLLVIEEEAYGGLRYSIHLSPNVEQLNSQEAVENSDVLHLKLPFCGIIKVEQASNLNSISMDLTSRATLNQESFRTLSEACPATICPTLQPLEDQNTTMTDSYHIAKNQPQINGTYAAVQPLCNLRSTPCNDKNEMGGSAAPSVPVEPAMVGISEQVLNPLIDTSFMEYLLDLQ